MTQWRGRAIGILAWTASLAGVQVAAQTSSIHPEKGQSLRQQAEDEAACRRWAREQSAAAPGAPAAAGAGDQTQETVQGAARGAAVGGIAGSAGKGAVVGAIAGRRESRRADTAGATDAQERSQRAFAACMEGRGYTVK